VVLIYLVLGLFGFAYFFNNSYFDADAWAHYLGDNWIIRIIVSVIIGLIFFSFYKTLFPAHYEKKKRIGVDYFAPGLVILLALVLNTGILLPLNSIFGYNEKIMIHGIITNKGIMPRSMGDNVYYVNISDTIKKARYYLRVKQNVYTKAKQNDVINKEFYIGKLGIVYRRGE
jgi:hypothetical protein